MLLIAESGATGTDWRLMDNENTIHQASTEGFNPYVHAMHHLPKMIQEGLLDSGKISAEKVSELYFYGAGCSEVSIVKQIKLQLSVLFPNAIIEIQHDLLAAARALCDGREGIACILGTGVNSCLYDGQQIVEHIPAMGYAMADEGSGAYLGKQLLNGYFRKGMPDTLAHRFQKRYNLTRAEVLEKVYRGDAPSQYMASFSKFIFQNLKEPYCYRLVYHGFETFFTENIMRYTAYEQKKVHFTGSVAFYYSNILRQVAQDKGISVKNITESPIAGLALYHRTDKTI